MLACFEHLGGGLQGFLGRGEDLLRTTWSR